MTSRGTKKKVALAFSALLIASPGTIWASGAMPANPTNPEGTSIREKWFGWVPKVGRSKDEVSANSAADTAIVPGQSSPGYLPPRDQLRTTNVYQANQAHLDPMMEQQRPEQQSSFWQRFKFGRKSEPHRDLEVVGGAASAAAATKGMASTPRAASANSSSAKLARQTRQPAVPQQTKQPATTPASYAGAKIPATGYAPTYSNNPAIHQAAARTAPTTGTVQPATLPAASASSFAAADPGMSAGGVRPIPIPVAKRRSQTNTTGLAQTPTFRTPTNAASYKPTTPAPVTPASQAMAPKPTEEKRSSFFSKLTGRFRRDKTEAPANTEVAANRGSLANPAVNPSTGIQPATYAREQRAESAAARANVQADVQSDVRNAANRSPAAERVIPVSAQSQAESSNQSFPYSSQRFAVPKPATPAVLAPSAAKAPAPAAPPAFRGWEQ